MVPCVVSAVKSGAVSLMRSTAGSSAIAVLMFSPPEFNNSACSKAPDLTCWGSRPGSERTKPDKAWLASVPGPRSWDILPRDLGSLRRPREMSIFARNHHPTGAAGKMQKRDCPRLLLFAASVSEGPDCSLTNPIRNCQRETHQMAKGGAEFLRRSDGRDPLNY